MSDVAHGINNNKEEEKEPRVSLQLIKGGKDDGIDEGPKDWLADVEEKEAFMVRRLKSEDGRPRMARVLERYIMMQKTDSSYYLINTTNQYINVFLPRPAYDFCQEYMKWESLGVVGIEEEVITDG